MLFTLLFALAAADEIPAIVRASPFFSQAFGSNSLAITSTARPTTVALGESLVFEITFGGVRNPFEVVRPKLALTDFAVDDLDAARDADGVSFRYRLRPRGLGVVEIPGVRIDYYQPEAAEDKQLRTRYTTSIPIVVTAPPVVKKTLIVPERFRTLIAESPSPPKPPVWLWVIVPLVVGALALAAIIAWHRQYPQGARLARLRRHRTVRRALDALERDPLDAFRRYLIERFDASPAQLTPSDARSLLTVQGVSAAVADEVASLLRDGDAARYGAVLLNLVERVRTVIQQLEER